MNNLKYKTFNLIYIFTLYINYNLNAEIKYTYNIIYDLEYEFKGVYKNSFNTTPPVILSFFPESGYVGTNVLIKGKNFSTSLEKNQVYIGVVKAKILSCTDSTISIVVPNGAVTDNVTVLNMSNRLQSYSSKKFKILFGHNNISTSTFSNRQEYKTGTTPCGISLSDFDLDGKTDIAISVFNPPCGISLYRNKIDLSNLDSNFFESKIDFNAGGCYPWYTRSIDMDGDGKKDVLLAGGNFNKLSLYRNISNAGVISSSTLENRIDLDALSNPKKIDFADLNKDGKYDIVFSNYGDSAISIVQNNFDTGVIIKSSFLPKIDLKTGLNPTGVKLADIDGDGYEDLIALNHHSNTMSVFKNIYSGTGFLTASSFSPKIDFQTLDRPYGLDVADIDDDGRMDIAITSNEGKLSIYRNNSVPGMINSSSLSPRVDFTVGRAPREVKLSDLNGDGKIDVIVSNIETNFISIFQNISSKNIINASSFSSRIDLITPEGPNGIEVGDINLDGFPDILVSNWGSHNFSVFTNKISNPQSDSVELNISLIDGSCNQQVDIPVKANRFQNLMSLQGSINWNTADLRFDSIVSYGPSAMAMNEGNIGTNLASTGRIAFSWNDPNASGLTLADSTTLFMMRFTALGSTVRSVPVTITGNPTPLEAYDGAFVKKTVVTTAGSVNVTCEFNITGKVLTPADKGVRNVTVTLTGGTSPLTTTTDSSGNYSFNKLLPGTYTLTPTKSYEQNKANGVSTLDLALMQSHLLQRLPFNSAYKSIAADANNSSSVTTGDILPIRRLILGVDTTLPNNRIWTFVDGDQTFANISNPFPFTATKTLTNQATNITHTFRGIKIGDVNYDRNPLLDQAPSGDTLRLFGEWTDTEDGYVTLRVKSHAVNGLMGWQSTLRWDEKQLQLQSVQGRITNLGIGDRWKDDGYLTLSWNDPMAEGLNLSEGVEWMELRFLKTDRLQRAGLGISEEKLVTEAFNKFYQSMGVKLEPTELRGRAWDGQLRVYPNPASNMMNVEWKMEKAGAATIRLLDAQGRVVFVDRGQYGAGLQRLTVQRSSGWSVSGTWMVQVECEGAVRQMPIIMIKQVPLP